MVNYCCVFGCARNSKTSKHLYYYSVPKEPYRQEQWLESAGRSDLLDKKPEKRILYRVCSRHFSQASIKNKHLCADAVPTLHLPRSGIEDSSDDSVAEHQTHPNISCNNCTSTSITGFRYKCISCPNYDLCSRCEMAEAHAQHFMLRIPAPAKFRNVDKMVQKWQEYYKEAITDNNEYTSDDEPITKYVKNYDSGIDLTENVKESIRKEVSRVLKQKNTDAKKKNQVVVQKRPSETDKPSKTKKIDSVDVTALFSDTSVMVFEDVDSASTSQPMDVKPKLQPYSTTSQDEADTSLPMIQMKLSEDLSELIMEVSDQKTMY